MQRRRVAAPRWSDTNQPPRLEAGLHREVGQKRHPHALAGRGVDVLGDVPTLSSSGEDGEVIWRLEGPGGTVENVRHTPRLSCGDFIAIRTAALAGLGVAMLPDHACAAELRTGALVQVLPEWRSEDGIVHLVFTTRTGLPPLVRAWMDHLAKGFKNPELFSKR